jgi:septal ring factor EnvC (AmiA/AmiB activator)
MTRTQRTPVQRQIARVHRRLILQTLLTHVLWCWAGALALSAGWFLVEPFLVPAPPGWLRPVASGGAVAIATLLGVVLAILRAPRRLDAALLLDERFGLKERVTTSLTLTPENERTPVALALLADVNQRVETLDIRARFPLRTSWLAAAAPACAAVLAIAAFYYQPPASQATPGPSASIDQTPKNADEIEKKINQLKKKAPERRALNRPAAQKLEEIEAELDKIINRPRATKEQLKDRIKEMTAQEDKLKNLEKDLADKSRSLKSQLRQMDQMANQNGNQEGPAKDLQKALSEGKLEEAKEELQKLTKKLKNNELTEKEKQQLAKQMKDLQQKLERLSEQKDKKDDLKKLHQEGKLDADALQRELKQLEEESQKLKDLQKLAKQLGRAQQALQNGKAGDAAESLQDAADQLKEIGLDDQDLQDIRDQLQRLVDAKDSC